MTYLSFDGGASWRNGGVPPQPAAGPAGDDVTVAFDAHGRGYVCATRSGHGSNLNPANPDANRAVYVWRTDDGGRSFSAPVTLVEGHVLRSPLGGHRPRPQPARRSMSTSPGAPAPRTRPSTSRAPPMAERASSRRAGSWRRPAIPSLVSAGPQLAAGPDGLVCAVCDWTSQQDSSGDMVGQVVAICSTDAGHSFAAPVHLGGGSGGHRTARRRQAQQRPNGRRLPQGDALYVAFPKHKPGATHSDIVVTASRDHGRTWSKPVTATPDDGVTYFQPNLAVDEAGRVAISAFALANGRIDEVLLVSRPRELRFRPPLRVTTAPFDPLDPTTASRGKYGAWWIGDWQGIAAGAGAFHLVWNDTRTGKLDLFAAAVRPDPG